MRRHIARARHHVARITEHKAELFWFVIYMGTLGVTSFHWWAGVHRDLLGTIFVAWLVIPIPLMFGYYRHRYEARSGGMSEFEYEQIIALEVTGWLFWLENILVAWEPIHRQQWSQGILAIAILAHYAGLIAYVSSSFERYNLDQIDETPDHEVEEEEYNGLSKDERQLLIKAAIRKNT